MKREIFFLKGGAGPTEVRFLDAKQPRAHAAAKAEFQPSTPIGNDNQAKKTVTSCDSGYASNADMLNQVRDDDIAQECADNERSHYSQAKIEATGPPIQTDTLEEPG